MLKKYLVAFLLLVRKFDFCNHPPSFIFMLEVGALQIFYCYDYFATQGSKPVCGVCVCVCTCVGALSADKFNSVSSGVWFCVAFHL